MLLLVFVFAFQTLLLLTESQCKLHATDGTEIEFIHPLSQTLRCDSQTGEMKPQGARIRSTRTLAGTNESTFLDINGDLIDDSACMLSQEGHPGVYVIGTPCFNTECDDIDDDVCAIWRCDGMGHCANGGMLYNAIFSPMALVPDFIIYIVLVICCIGFLASILLLIFRPRPASRQKTS